VAVSARQIYLDMDSGIDRPLEGVLGPSDPGLWQYDEDSNLIQWVLVHAPKDEAMAKIIELSTSRILAGEHNIYLATGPHVMNDAFLRHHGGVQVYDANTRMSKDERLRICMKAGAKHEDRATFAMYCYAACESNVSRLPRVRFARLVTALRCSPQMLTIAQQTSTKIAWSATRQGGISGRLGFTGTNHPDSAPGSCPRRMFPHGCVVRCRETEERGLLLQCDAQSIRIANGGGGNAR
jgi:hypothetical protein